MTHCVVTSTSTVTRVTPRTRASRTICTSRRPHPRCQPLRRLQCQLPLHLRPQLRCRLRHQRHHRHQRKHQRQSPLLHQAGLEFGQPAARACQMRCLTRAAWSSDPTFISLEVRPGYGGACGRQRPGRSYLSLMYPCSTGNSPSTSGSTSLSIYDSVTNAWSTGPSVRAQISSWPWGNLAKD